MKNDIKEAIILAIANLTIDGQKITNNLTPQNITCLRKAVDEFCENQIELSQSDILTNASMIVQKVLDCDSNPETKSKPKTKRHRVEQRIDKPAEIIISPNASSDAIKSSLLTLIANSPGFTANIYVKALKNIDEKIAYRLIFKMIEDKIILVTAKSGKKSYSTLSIKGNLYSGQVMSIRQLAAHSHNIHRHSKSTLAYRLKRGWSVTDALRIPVTANNMIK